MKKLSQYKEEAENIVVITLGDPAGIGAEITLKALGSSYLPQTMQPLLIGCKRTLQHTYLKLKSQGIRELANPDELEIKNLPLTKTLIEGQANAHTGKASFDWLTKGTEILLENKARALVTAPIAKYAWEQAGFNYPGQTERLGELSNIQNPSMLFTAKSPYSSFRLNTLLATTHIPLEDVPKNLTPKLVWEKLDTLLSFCQKFKKNPR